MRKYIQIPVLHKMWDIDFNLCFYVWGNMYLVHFYQKGDHDCVNHHAQNNICVHENTHFL